MSAETRKIKPSYGWNKMSNWNNHNLLNLRKVFPRFLPIHSLRHKHLIRSASSFNHSLPNKLELNFWQHNTIFFFLVDNIAVLRKGHLGARVRLMRWIQAVTGYTTLINTCTKDSTNSFSSFWKLAFNIKPYMKCKCETNLRHSRMSLGEGRATIWETGSCKYKNKIKYHPVDIFFKYHDIGNYRRKQSNSVKYTL